MQDQITLLIEETGCSRSEAELALETCGYEVEAAVKEIARLLRDIVVIKGKFLHPDGDKFGLVLVALNVKSGALLRARAVLSFNPAVYAVDLGKHWFEFEKFLYGCRLWEGSLQTESLEIERQLASHFRGVAPVELDRLMRESAVAVAARLAGVLKALFHAAVRKPRFEKEILNLSQFQSLSGQTEARRGPARGGQSAVARIEEPLALKVEIDEDPQGVAVGDLRAADVVQARIIDPRDIAQYLSKLFGGYSQNGLMPIAVPVEAVESNGKSVLVRVRFSVGVCGDAAVPRDRRVKILRPEAIATGSRRRQSPWWRRFFNA